MFLELPENVFSFGKLDFILGSCVAIAEEDLSGVIHSRLTRTRTAPVVEFYVIYVGFPRNM